MREQHNLLFAVDHSEGHEDSQNPARSPTVLVDGVTPPNPVKETAMVVSAAPITQKK